MSATEATDETDLELEAEPPAIELPTGHPKLGDIKDALREIFDPEIPVNIYELGLIYKIDIDVENNVAIRMTLTAPACPVAGEMPGQVKEALEGIDGIGNVDVELVWDPPWNPSLMAETAKLQLGMF